MKTEHIILVGLVVLAVVFIMNQQRKEHLICYGEKKNKNYRFNEQLNKGRCTNDCHCNGKRGCTNLGYCVG